MTRSPVPGPLPRIGEKLAQRHWSPVHFDNLLTYGTAARVRELAAGGLYFDPDPLDWDLGVGVCGATANQLAKALLGNRDGEALRVAVNAVQNQVDRDHVASAAGITFGCGVENLREALRGSQRRIAIINFGANHRLLLEQGPCAAVELLQGWYNPEPGQGYTFARWFISAGVRLRHSTEGFITLLSTALTGSDDLRRSANEELFAPVGAQFTEMLDRDLRPTFAIRDVEFQQITTSLTNFCNTPLSIFG
ncbi:hypothetical protein [Corallococcus sp. CA047B]|uniref:hypothetical protein n=1 Tax=Corallococcus sp. CA047B TaxID=2316729 RepID=UPI001F2F46BD|nr:hypothetical protein [Corallococcus sp. CA047B]